MQLPEPSVTVKKVRIRKRYTDGQEDQLGALGQVTNAVVLLNTIYLYVGSTGSSPGAG